MEESKKAVFRRLADHLNQLPDGYPPSTTDADLRVLERLFSVEEAELAVHLTLERESAEVIAQRAELDSDVVANRLSEMASKGLIFSVAQDDAPPLYQAVPFVVGIFEFQVNDLTPEFLADLGEYAQTRGDFPRVKSIPQVRTVPVEISLKAEVGALPYERVGELIGEHDRFAVSPCLCRTITKMAGGGCDASLDTCMYFGEWADYIIRTNRGREVSHQDIQDLVKQANESNLVLQSSNTKTSAVICCCCGCCCGVLVPLKQLENPAAEVSSSYIARYDAEKCVGCHTCVDRCQMDAIKADGKKIEFLDNRCIGCGLCVSTCPSEALQLERKADANAESLPEDIGEMWSVMKQALVDADRQSAQEPSTES